MKARTLGENRGEALGVGVSAHIDKAHLMWINADRAVYCGLLGEPTVRKLGGFSIYLSLQGEHRICVGNSPFQAGRLSVVPPHVPHRIATGERTICNLLVEAETVDPRALPTIFQRRPGTVDDECLFQRLHGAMTTLLASNGAHPASSGDFDRFFFGGPLQPLPFDPRIQGVLDRIRANPTAQLSAQQSAGAACMSESRFLHRFSAEVGTPFRKLRTWKRARAFLYYVRQHATLTEVALDVGYPDATHFSHSIRQIYGLTPKSIVAGSRRLALIADASRAFA